MKKVAIVAGGPAKNIPKLQKYVTEVDVWIGADRGAVTILEAGLTLDIAIGDFDSITEVELEWVESKSLSFVPYATEKDETDLELAVSKAYEFSPSDIYLFGVTGGRMDHQLASIQLLYCIKKRFINGIVVDMNSYMELALPGTHSIEKDATYPYISFLPFSEQVIGISLEGFYYKLNNKNIFWGSSRCISNQLISQKGTFSFREGILIVIKSRDVLI
jgi:thiamine pyrophosphokinase